MDNSATINRQPPTANHNSWPEIWGKKGLNLTAESITKGHTTEEIVLELKQLAGHDSIGVQAPFETFYRYHTQYKNELSFSSSGMREISSVFEIGCGAGAELYLFQQEGLKVGGIDYADSLVKVAGGVLDNPVELLCGEAKDTPSDVKYDSVFSNGVFFYFPSQEYAEKVLEIMYEKSRYSIGLTSHDLAKKDAFLEYRSQTIKDYAERYRGLDRLFLGKDFFLNFAEKHGLSVRFSTFSLPSFWNNDFSYNVFMTRE